MADDLIRREDAISELYKWISPYNSMSTAISAGLRTLPAAEPSPALGVKVKPLSWFEVERSRHGGKYTADGYTIRYIEGLWLVDFAGNLKQVWRFPTLALAQAAAQSDYDARIRAALEPAPADALGAEWMRERTVKSLRDWQSDLEKHRFPNAAHTASLAANIVSAIPGPTPADLLAHALRLPEVSQLVEAAKHQGYVDGYAAAVSDVEVMRATDGVLAGQGLIISGLEVSLTKLRAILAAVSPAPSQGGNDGKGGEG